MHTPQVSSDALHPSDPGVRVARRSLLRSSLALPLFAGLSRSVFADAGSSGAVPGFGRFVDEWAKRAADVVADERANEDATLCTLMAEVARLDRGAIPARGRDAFVGDGLVTGPIHADAAFLVLELELEPGARITAHNHVGWSFLSLAVEGDALARHFEPEGKDAPPPAEVGAEFLLREVASMRLSPGRMTSLTRTRANIHDFRAGADGLRMIDFGLHFPDAGEGPKTFSALEIGARPRDAEERLYDGRWLGNIYAKK